MTIDTTRLVAKSATYSISTSTAMTDRVLLEVASQYQAQIAGKMIPLKPDDLPRRYTGNEHVLATRKIDGEGVFVYVDAARSPSIVTFNAPSGRVRLGLPAAEALGQHLLGKGIRRALIRCELYLPSAVAGKRNSSGDVARASFSTDAKDHAAFRLALLDIIMLDGVDWRVHQSAFLEIWKKLAELAEGDRTDLFHVVPGQEIAENSVANFFKKEVESGSEGLVIRRLNRPEIVKAKPHLTFDTVILGYVETDVEGLPGVGSILTGLVYPDSPPAKLAIQVLARVGSGLDDALRKSLLEQFRAHQVPAPIAMADSDGEPIIFVAPRWVLEIEADDVVSSVRNEKDHATQLLSWSGSNYTFHRIASCPQVSFPIFGKLRPDKSFETGALMSQLVANPVVPPLEPVAAGEPPSVLRREVYRKDGKAGDAAVRKLVVVQRHEPDGFPFVVFWTDYSSRRKEPLKVTTQFAATRERADQLAAVLVEEGVTKGFGRVEVA
jgi:hypothetical protein